MRIRRVGDRALLAETGDPAGLAAAVRAHAGARVQDVVPGHETVLVVWREPPVDSALLDVPVAAGEVARAQVTVPVVYDGPDLQAVAGHLGCSSEEVARRHAATRWRVAFLGFAPGFGYLLGGEGEVPRREQPRERVPAGAVALAGPYSAVYPTASPGGWQLIGRTDLRMWDADRDPPSLLEPGTEIVFAP